MPSILSNLNELCGVLENEGALREAQLVHNVFLRVAQFETDKIAEKMKEMRKKGVECPVCGDTMDIEDDLCTCSDPDCACKRHLRDLAVATLDAGDEEDVADSGYAANVTKYAKKKAKKKKNVPNNPKLWAECQAWAKRTYEVHPSAYSNAGAARRYREKGGTWRKE